MKAIRLTLSLLLGTVASTALAQQASGPFSPLGNAPTTQPAAPFTQTTTEATVASANRIVNNLRNFLIPFQLAANAQNVAEVHLYLSVDRGQHWQLHQRQAPSNKNFPFRATADGEYWFAVRTVGTPLTPISPADIKPELIVVVDTESPRLNLRLQNTSDGQVQAEWYADDPHLQPNTFRLQYENRQGQWLDIPLSKESGPEVGSASPWWQSQTTWHPYGVGAELVVRAEVSDLAGNSQVVQKQLAITDTGPSTEPFAVAPSDVRTSSDVRSPTDSPARGQSWDELASEVLGGITAPSPWDHPEDASTNTRPTTDRSNVWAPPVDHNRLSQRPFDQQYERQASGSRNQDGSESESARSNDDWFEPRTFDSREPLAGRVEQPVADQRSAALDRRSQEPVFHPRISASPNFDLVYDVYGVDRDQPRRVELWYTRDRGRTWKLYGGDPDHQSPMEVRVQDEGLYGFQLTVDTGRGTPPEAPAAGAEPDVWVIVDWTKPTAQINRMTLPQGLNSPQITIEWTAHDTGLLAEAPISLSYSDHPQGPWQPIAKDLANSGIYQWNVDRRLPQQLYIQLEVRDVVGNVATHTHDAMGGPRSRIRDVRPNF